VVHLKSNIQALNVGLTVDDIKEIEAADPFDFGYPHSLLAGNRYIPVSSTKPGRCVESYSLFAGVDEAEASLASQSDSRVRDWITDVTLGNRLSR
jgi:hypothetical protein